MALNLEILGQPGRDNAAFLRIDTGQSIYRLLFDCGQGCLDGISIADAQQIEHLFFSHFHMDHVSGFDGLFRLNYSRPGLPMRVYGPPGTTDIMEHRMRGFLWNLHRGHPGEWEIHEIQCDNIFSGSYFAGEAFRTRHPHAEQLFDRNIYSCVDYDIEAIFLDHGTPTMGYIVREAPRSNILMAPIAGLGLKPGSWMQQLKDPAATGSITLPSGKPIALEELRAKCLQVSSGESFAYLTDFMLTPETIEPLADRIRNVDTLLCESQYLDADTNLALQNKHMTASRCAELAKLADVRCLVLFHISDRYMPEERLTLLDEAKAIFPNTGFPPNWNSYKDLPSQ